MSALYRVSNVTRETVLAERCSRAGVMRRGIGLMGRRGLEAGTGLIIEPCNSVVSFFMRFTIDVVFVDKGGSVVYTLPRFVPWRTSRIVRGSRLVVELPEGTIDRTATHVGDSIRIEPS